MDGYLEWIFAIYFQGSLVIFLWNLSLMTFILLMDKNFTESILYDWI